MTARIWFTGCTHIDHEKIIGLARRPFADVKAMNETLIDNWNSNVAPEDTVYHLGDVSWGPPSDFFSRVNGRKYVIAGNHDERAGLVTAKRDGLIEDFKDYHRMDLKIGEERVSLVLFHYPVEDWDGRFRGSIHLHCHTHAAEMRNASVPVIGADDNFSKGEAAGSLPMNYPPEITCNRFNVGVDACGFAPVPLERILEESRRS